MKEVRWKAGKDLGFGPQNLTCLNPPPGISQAVTVAVATQLIISIYSLTYLNPPTCLPAQLCTEHSCTEHYLFIYPDTFVLKFPGTG